MAKKNYKAEEIIQHLRTHELNIERGMGKDESARKIGVTLQTINSWKREYGGLRIDQAKRLKELEKENAQLKKALANEVLDKAILKEALSGNY